MSLSANAYSGMTHLQDPGDFADDGYGSLMGGGGAKKKKKPVLVLDADELEQAHQAIAMGGQTIMEAEDEPEAMERIRMPSSMLGLAPMGSDAEEDETDYGLSDEDAGSFADQEPEEYSEEGLSEEEELEDDSASIDLNLDHLLRPASREERDPDDEESIPSIEEQLKKMRALPIQEEERPAETSFDPAPELDEPVAFEPKEDAPLAAEPVAFQPEDVEPLEPELEQDEPVSFAAEDVEPLHTEPEQFEPQSFDPQEAVPEVQPEATELEEPLPETEEQHFVSEEPIPAEGEQVEAQDVDVEHGFSDWSVSEAEAESEPEMDSEPAIESEEMLSEPEAVDEPEQELEVENVWVESEEAVLPGQLDEPELEPLSELTEAEWTSEPLEAPLEIAENDAPEEEPVAEQVEPPLAEEADAVDADAPPALDEDQWETPEAEWPQQEPEQGDAVDPVGLEVPAVEEGDLDKEEPVSFVAEEVEEAEVFVPEAAPAPEPELPPVPRNSLRARVYQMEEQRQARGPSLLGRIWNRLFGG